MILSAISIIISSIAYSIISFVFFFSKHNKLNEKEIEKLSDAFLNIPVILSVTFFILNLVNEFVVWNLNISLNLIFGIIIGVELPIIAFGIENYKKGINSFIVSGIITPFVGSSLVVFLYSGLLGFYAPFSNRIYGTLLVVYNIISISVYIAIFNIVMKKYDLFNKKGKSKIKQKRKK